MFGKSKNVEEMANEYKRDFAGHYQDAKDVAQNLVKDVKDKANEVKGQIAENVKVGAEKVKEKANERKEQFVEYTKDNPWKAVGIGVVVGFVLAKLLKLCR